MSRTASRIRELLRAQPGFTLVEMLVTMAIVGLVMAGVLTLLMTGSSVGTSGVNQSDVQQASRAAMLMQEDLRMAGAGLPAGQLRFTAATATSVTFRGDVTSASKHLFADAASGASSLRLGSYNASCSAPGPVCNLAPDASGFAAGDTLWIGAEPRSVTGVAVNGTVTVNLGVTSDYSEGALVGRIRCVTYQWTGQTLERSEGAGLVGGGDHTCQDPVPGLQPMATGIQPFQLRYFDQDNTEIPVPVAEANLPRISRVEIQMTAQAGSGAEQRSFQIVASATPRN